MRRTQMKPIIQLWLLVLVQLIDWNLEAQCVQQNERQVTNSDYPHKHFVNFNVARAAMARSYNRYNDTS